jgi:thiol-disulfide isomerase/thioredoxin
VRRLLLTFCLGVLAIGLRAQQPSPLVGHPAPSIEGVDLDGKPVSLAALRGKVVLVNFWGSWCGPCLVEMPRFAEWRRQHPADLAVLGISMDDEPTTAQRIRAKLALDYPILMATPALATAYGGILGLPVSFLVDRRGTVRERFEGEQDLSRLEARIHQLLAEP